MAFMMNGESLLPADRETVWQDLNDPAMLRACIPGCQQLDQKEDGGFAAVVKVKIGPVSATFKGAVDLTDLDPPSGYRIVGQGEGGAAGFARGGATVSLIEQDRGTLLRYDVDAVIGGRLAQLGGRLVNGVAKKLADEFFVKFATLIEERHGGSASA